MEATTHRPGTMKNKKHNLQQDRKSMSVSLKGRKEHGGMIKSDMNELFKGIQESE